MGRETDKTDKGLQKALNSVKEQVATNHIKSIREQKWISRLNWVSWGGWGVTPWDSLWFMEMDTSLEVNQVRLAIWRQEITSIGCHMSMYR